MALAKTPPTLFAVIGLVLLWLTPFSILKNMQIFSIAVFIAGVVKIFSRGRGNGTNILVAYHRNRLRTIIVFLLLISIYALCMSIISFLSLEVIEASGTDLSILVWRLFSQFGAMLVYMFMIVCGYHMAVYYQTSNFNSALYLTFVLMVAVCIYQLLADRLGLPYIGNYAFDRISGLRLSGLASEPKYLAGYFAIMMIYLLHILTINDFSRNNFGFFASLTGLISAAYLFKATSSGNGVIVVLIGLMLYLFAVRNQVKVFGGFVISALLILFIFTVDFGSIFVRESHVSLLENISQLELSLFDDLIMLPLMAWDNNIIRTITGFGPGMMHFYALPYVNYSSWIATEDIFIEGNVSAITYISNFGIILYFLLLSIIMRQALGVLKSKSDRSICLFFVCSFFVGALIQGNVSIPFYLSIGWLLRWKLHQRQEANGMAAR